AVEIHGPLDTGLFETALRRTVAEADTFALRFSRPSERSAGSWTAPCAPVPDDAAPGTPGPAAPAADAKSSVSTASACDA
ncbi:hypothetical protein ACWD0J_32340, partial [Streptomyces sp. NPDC003011]